MPLLSFTDLVQMPKIFVQEWTQVGVRSEPLIPVRSNAEGSTWNSNWDNWVVVGDDSFMPIITYQGIMLVGPASLNGEPIDGADTTGYALYAGDRITGKIVLTGSHIPAEGYDAVIQATFRRSIYRNSWWERNVSQALDETYRRLLRTPPDLSEPGAGLDTISDPWSIVSKQAGRNALISLQTLMAGFGKSKIESVETDMSRAGQMIKESIQELGAEIDRDISRWCWSHSPGPVMANPYITPLRCGFGGWGR